MPRRYWYDTEFLDNGRTIELISIGIVADDDRSLYLVNADAPWARIARQTWLMANVVPHLPGWDGRQRRSTLPAGSIIDLADPAVQPKSIIAERVRAFLTGSADGREQEPAELWAWYAAYDHVALAQLWGPMINLPGGVPMFTHDLQQEVARRGNPTLPPQATSCVHHALADAETLRHRWEWLQATRPDCRCQHPELVSAR